MESGDEKGGCSSRRVLRARRSASCVASSSTASSTCDGDDDAADPLVIVFKGFRTEYNKRLVQERCSICRQHLSGARAARDGTCERRPLQRRPKKAPPSACYSPLQQRPFCVALAVGPEAFVYTAAWDDAWAGPSWRKAARLSLHDSGYFAPGVRGGKRTNWTSSRTVATSSKGLPRPLCTTT